MGDEPTDDRRASPRLPVELSVEYRHLGRPHESFADISRNVSAGGVFVETSVALELGTRVELEISSDRKGESVRVMAEVVRVEAEPAMTGSKATDLTRGMALRFTDGDAQAVESLLKLGERAQAAEGQRA